jgi:Domain of unknown function (DUF4148)
MSKMIVGLALVAATLGAPVLSFAQSNAPLTRAEVRADLIRLEQAGYTPSENDVNYSGDIQAAEEKVAAQNGSTASGSASHTAMHPSCTGPVSFCNVFFGN